DDRGSSALSTARSCFAVNSPDLLPFPSIFFHPSRFLAHPARAACPSTGAPTCGSSAERERVALLPSPPSVAIHWTSPAPTLRRSSRCPRCQTRPTKPPRACRHSPPP